MGLSNEFKKRIKVAMDLNEGGCLHDIANKAVAINAPVLVIGLGGTGVDSLLVTKKLIYDNIQRSSFEEKPQNIEYLAIDTDEHSRDESYQGIKFKQNKEEVKVYTMPNVLPILAHPDLLPEYISKWLDCSIENDSVIWGSRAVRQVGRLALMNNAADIIHVLREKIEKITGNYPTNIPLYVFILTGICGGTGGGMFIDVPYLIKAVADSLYGGRQVYNIGLLFMPDVNVYKKGCSELSRSICYTNSFAALKELDYVMNIENTGDVFEQNYGVWICGGSKEGKSIKPYDVCMLLSGKNINGELLASGDEIYQLTVQTAAETIFNFILEDSGTCTFSDFNISSWIEIEARNREIYQCNLQDNRHPVSYAYTTLGTATAKLPTDNLMSYMAYRMYQEAEGLWDQEPEEQDIDEVEKFFHLTKEMLVSGAFYGMKYVNTHQIDAKTVISDHQQVVQLYDVELKRQQKKVVDNLENMLNRLRGDIEDEYNILNQYFRDPEKGPVFAQRCLYTGTRDQRSVITDLHRYKQEFAYAVPKPEKIGALEQQVGIALESLKKTLFGKNIKLQEYIREMDELYKAKLGVFLFSELQIFCKKADVILSDKRNEIFDMGSDLLYIVMPIFQNYCRAHQAEVNVDNCFSWNIVNPVVFENEMKKKMDSQPEFSLDFHTVVQDFYTYLFQNMNAWKGHDEDIVENINTFFSKEFQVVLDQNMDFFLKMIADSEGKVLEQYVGKIIEELVKRAETRFNRNGAMDVELQPGYYVIFVPDNSPRLLSIAQATASTIVTPGYVPVIVKESRERKSISVMKFESAVPLSKNGDIKEFYRCYMIHRDHSSGLHLYVPTKVNNQISDIDWRKLPSPYPESEWWDFEDPEERTRNDEYREILKKAIDYGYVEENVANRTITLHYGTTVDINAFAAKYSINLQSDTPVENDEALKFVREIKASLKKEAIADRCENHLIRWNMVQDINGTLKKSYEEMAFIQMYKPRNYIKDMVQNHENALNVMLNVRKRAGK